MKVFTHVNRTRQNIHFLYSPTKALSDCFENFIESYSMPRMQNFRRYLQQEIRDKAIAVNDLTATYDSIPRHQFNTLRSLSKDIVHVAKEEFILVNILEAIVEHFSMVREPLDRLLKGQEVEPEWDTGLNDD